MNKPVCMDLEVVLKISAEKESQASKNDLPKQQIPLKRPATTENHTPQVSPKKSLLAESHLSEHKKSTLNFSTIQSTTPPNYPQVSPKKSSLPPKPNSLEHSFVQSKTPLGKVSFNDAQTERTPNNADPISENSSSGSDDYVQPELKKVLIQVDEEELSEKEEESPLDSLDKELPKFNHNHQSFLQAFRYAITEYCKDKKKQAEELSRFTKAYLLNSLNKELDKIGNLQDKRSAEIILLQIDNPLKITKDELQLIIELFSNAFKVGITVYQLKSPENPKEAVLRKPETRVVHERYAHFVTTQCERIINLEIIEVNGFSFFRLDRACPIHKENENLFDYLDKRCNYLHHWFNYMDPNYESHRILRDQKRGQSIKYSKILYTVLKHFEKDRPSGDLFFKDDLSYEIQMKIMQEICTDPYYYTNELLFIDPDFLKTRSRSGIHPLKYFFEEEFLRKYHHKKSCSNWTVNHDDFILEIISKALKIKIEIKEENCMTKRIFGCKDWSESMSLLCSKEQIYELDPSERKLVFENVRKTPYSDILDVMKVVNVKNVQKELLARKFYYEEFVKKIYGNISLDGICTKINHRIDWSLLLDELLLEVISNTYECVIFVYYYDEHYKLICTRVYKPETSNFLSPNCKLAMCKLNYCLNSKKFSMAALYKVGNLLPIIFNHFNQHPKPIPLGIYAEFLLKFEKFAEHNREFMESIFQQYDDDLDISKFFKIIRAYFIEQTKIDRMKQNFFTILSAQPLIDYKKSYDNILIRLISCVFDCRLKIYDKNLGEATIIYDGKNPRPSREINLLRSDKIFYEIIKKEFKALQ